MTVTRATFTLDPEAFSFLSEMAGKNRSAYINRLLKKEKQRTLEQAMLKANLEEAEDSDVLASIEDWDATLSDGLRDDV